MFVVTALRLQPPCKRDIKFAHGPLMWLRGPRPCALIHSSDVCNSSDVHWALWVITMVCVGQWQHKPYFAVLPPGAIPYVSAAVQHAMIVTVTALGCYSTSLLLAPCMPINSSTQWWRCYTCCSTCTITQTATLHAAHALCSCPPLTSWQGMRSHP